MRTGRITLSVYNENGGLQEKAFNFSFDRYVNYMHAYRILDKLHKPNYRMYFRGGVKKPGKNPVMTWGEVCSAIRDWQFCEVNEKPPMRITKLEQKVIYIPKLTYFNYYVKSHNGEWYAFLHCKKEERNILREALLADGIYAFTSIYGTLFIRHKLLAHFEGGFLTLVFENSNL